MNGKNSPGAETEAVKNSAGELNSYTEYRPRDAEYEARLAAWLDGYHQRDREVERLGQIADRLYAEMVRRPGKPFEDPNRPSYADLERIRGNTANADRIDAANAVRFAQVTS